MKPVGSRKDAGSLARSGASTRLVGILISIGPDQLGGSGELAPKEERARDEHGNGRLNHQAARVRIDVGEDHAPAQDRECVKASSIPSHLWHPPSLRVYASSHPRSPCAV